MFGFPALYWLILEWICRANSSVLSYGCEQTALGERVSVAWSPRQWCVARCSCCVCDPVFVDPPWVMILFTATRNSSGYTRAPAATHTHTCIYIRYIIPQMSTIKMQVFTRENKVRFNAFFVYLSLLSAHTQYVTVIQVAFLNICLCTFFLWMSKQRRCSLLDCVIGLIYIIFIQLFQYSFGDVAR